MKHKDWQGLAQSLLTTHYDPAYDHSVSRHDREEWLNLSQSDCSEEQRRKTVNKILSRLDEFTARQEVQSLKKGIELYK